MDKLVFIKGTSAGVNIDDINDDYLSDGWKVHDVFPQKVSNPTSSGYGGFLVILKK